MDALGVEIGDVGSDFFGDLAVDADAGLHVERGMEVRIDGVEGGNGRGEPGESRGRYSGVGVIEGGVRDYVAFLVNEIVAKGLDEVGRAAASAPGVSGDEAV